MLPRLKEGIEDKNMSPCRRARYYMYTWPVGLSLSLSFLLSTLLMLSPYAGTVLASGNPPSVDAGPAKVIAFPAKDLTLFGHATDPEGDQMTYAWSQVSGPSGATFSAPWALA